jgi:hypothetical protein
MDDSELLDMLHGVRTAHIRVCRMSNWMAGQLGASTNIVLLSRMTVEKLESKHKTRDMMLYRLAETIICDGTPYRDSECTAVSVWRSPPDALGKVEIYKAVMKAARHGREIFLTTVHRIDEAGERAIIARAEKYWRCSVR